MIRAPRFVPFGTTAPAGSLAVDGAVTGAAAIYSHWQGDHTTPPELAADTSTGMLVRAAFDEARWLAPFTTVANNHIDADGLLSVLAACRPDLARRHAPRLIAAASTGDFTAWTGPLAYEVVLRLHQAIRQAKAGGDGWEQRCLDRVIRDGDALLTGEWPGGDERQAAIAQVEAIIAALPAPELHGRLAVVRWTRRIGHASDTFLDVYRPDDLPLVALSTRIAPDRFQLLLEEAPEGTTAWLDAPRHSWARTTDLPAVAWPDLAPLADRLRALESDVPWIGRPGAAQVGFTCLLASRSPSRLPVDDLINHIATACG